MRLSTRLAVTAFCGIVHYGSASLRNVKNLLPKKHTRNLQSNEDGFAALDCNQSIEKCTPFESTFGSGPFPSRVVIECGKCYTIGQGTKTLQFQDGLDIQGKLVIPEAAQSSDTLTIESPMVVVQGQLDIFATKAIDGNPNVKFMMNGSSDNFFTGADNNSAMCDGSCNVGQRSITVAGGRVNLNGIPADTPTFLKLFDVDGDSAIVVPDDVIGKWEVGAEIVITSNTQNWWADQPRTITSVTRARESGFTRLGLDYPIDRPSTIRDNVGFAVEVALLSRNIVFDSEGVGGHFWILQTPSVEQMIEGVEIVNFGQQGTLGRYPVHFHLCGNVSGSKVSKNTVRASNQRCFVVHGSDNLLIEGNVAYDTKGHCYMTEDGIETGNSFIRNIGIRTSQPETIIPNMGSNGVETDNDASTFWITNPTNSWIGNIVAGSESFGTWFELKKRGTKKDAPEFAHIDPMHDDTVEFSGNEFHSVGRVALKFYLSGYEPTSLTAFSNLSFNRNSLSALNVHRTRNIHIIHSFFQDNSLSIDIDRAEEFHLSDSIIIGHSDGYAEVVKNRRYGNPRKPCSGNANRLQGVLFQPTNPQQDYIESPLNGLMFNNVSLSGYEESNCGEVLSLGLDSFELKNYQTFEMYSVFNRVDIAPKSLGLDFCHAIGTGSDDTYVTDLSGSLAGAPGRAQSIIRNTPELLRFIPDRSKCTERASKCLTACVDTCFRSVHVYLSKNDYPDHKLKVCDRNNKSMCMEIEGRLRGAHSGQERYTLHVPSGREYNVNFVDDNGEDVYIQDDADIYYRDVLCPTAPKDADIRFLERSEQETAAPTTSPTALDEVCTSLTSAGDELASSWEARNSGSITQAGATGIKYVGSGTQNIVAGPELVTWSTLPHRECFRSGTVWEFRARLQLLEGGTSIGAMCDPKSLVPFERCPVITLMIRDEQASLFQSSFSGYQLLSFWNADGFNEFSGFFQVPSEEEGYLGRPLRLRMNFAQFPKGLDLIVDSFAVVQADQVRDTSSPTISPLTLQPTALLEADTCDGLTDPGVMMASSWEGRRYGTVVQDGPDAIKYLSTGSATVVSGPELLSWSTLENRNCFVAGSRWEFRAQLELFERGTSIGASCDTTSTVKFDMCPVILLTLRDAENKLFQITIRPNNNNDNLSSSDEGDDDGIYWNAFGPNEFVATFTVPTDGSWVGDANNMRVGFVQFPKNMDLRIEDFVVNQIVSS